MNIGASPSKIAPQALYRPLSYVERLAVRPLDTLAGVVIHCTELPDLATAREYGERIHYTESGTGNCGHFYVDREGGVECWAPVDRVAHHTRGYNPATIGIELVNRGRYPDWFDSRCQEPTEDYPENQLAALRTLLDALAQALPTLHWIAGHEDLDLTQVPATDNAGLLVSRKRDPGPRFPWDGILGSGGLVRFQPQGEQQ